MVFKPANNPEIVTLEGFRDLHAKNGSGKSIVFNLFKILAGTSEVA
jgi:hypothetical protein